MRKRTILTIAVLLVFPALVCRAGNYNFIKIAESTDGYSNFTKPAVNSSGMVAFGATLGGSGHLFTSSGGAATPIYNQTITSPSINDSGQTSFISQNNVYRLTNGTQTTITSFPPSPYAATIDNSGRVYVTIQDDVGNLISGDGGMYTSLGLLLHAGAPAVSSNGHYAATGNSLDNNFFPHLGSSVLTDLSANLVFSPPPVVIEFGDPDVNSVGTLVVSVLLTDIYTIYRSDNGVTTKTTFGPGIPAINDSGLIAALTTSNNKALKIGTSGPADTVLSVGDPFMGSTVTDLAFTHEGFSNGNYLAFEATLADGRTGIYLTAVPEPALLGVILPMMLFGRRRSIRH